jgi:hypothetical protein
MAFETGVVDGRRGEEVGQCSSELFVLLRSRIVGSERPRRVGSNQRLSISTIFVIL